MDWLSDMVIFLQLWWLLHILIRCLLVLITVGFAYSTQVRERRVDWLCGHCQMIAEHDCQTWMEFTIPYKPTFLWFYKFFVLKLCQIISYCFKWNYFWYGGFTGWNTYRLPLEVDQKWNHQGLELIINAIVPWLVNNKWTINL